MEKNYIHLDHENNIYAAWEKSGAFSPKVSETATSSAKSKKSSAKKSFTIMMPPPNANDPLHIGHAMFVSLEDIMIRYHRMLGEEALWLPGTDHAGIETQFVFEKKLKKDGKSRFQFDRETLYKMIWDYVQENSDIAVNQLRKMGASADWSRFTFMLDPEVVKVVLETFTELYKKELVYRDFRLVNYCPRCGTAFSDLEVDHAEKIDPLYKIYYQVADGSAEPAVVATVRPETIFADVAIAIHPKHKRAKELRGKKVLNPFTGLEIPVIEDETVDLEFGTGMLKITPAHDQHDFEVAQKHSLPSYQTVNFMGKVDLAWLKGMIAEKLFAELSETFHRKSVIEARKLSVEYLTQKGAIIDAETKKDYSHNVGTCYRCAGTIEPLPMPQFFVKVKPLTEPVLKALKTKKVKVLGAGHDKILKHWLENLRDWNISRQIVWGIRMPIWYDVKKNPEIEVTFLDKNGEKQTGKLTETLQSHTLAEISKGLQELRAPMKAEFEVATECPGENHIQETDTFDTWFSSAQWPYATLMAQEVYKNSPDFNNFYPTQVMETGYDILPFWVMRMLMMGMFKTGQVPFGTVYLHGLVRDEKGQKMSKSKGNVINPLTIIEKYGADALRMALVIRSSAGLDKSVGEGDFKAMRNFTNKIWNAARYISMTLEEDGAKLTETATGDTEFEKHLAQTVKDVTQQLTDFKLGLAAETTYNEFWHWFCDQCIEQAKQGEISQKALLEGLKTFLKLLHPFVPFVTEAVWQELARQPQTKEFFTEELLILSEWPVTEK